MNVDWLELLGETPAVSVTGVSIDQGSPSIQVGETLRLTTTFTPASPAPTNQVVTWASDDTGVAMVNANGDVTGIEEGTATITVTTEDGAFTDQVTVTVTENGPGTYYSTRLSGSPTEQYGLAKSLSVMPGDVVDIEVYAKYIDADPQNWTPLLNNLIAAISIPSGGIFVDGGQPGSGGSPPPYTVPHDEEAGEAPKAYLNYIIMDRDFNKVIDMGAKPVTTAAKEYGQNGQHERLFFDDIVVREAGYMYIYLSNEGEELVDVFFDDLKVTHQKSNIVEAQDYYPYGLTFNSYQRENSTPNQYQYNGKELQDELDLGWLDYGARMYMPDLGRWGVVDMKTDSMTRWSPYNYAFDNPIRYIDPDGMDPREGNEVQKVDFNKARVVALHGKKTGLVGSDVRDRPLYRRARSEYIKNLGPTPGGLPTRPLEGLDAADGFLSRDADKAGYSGAWVEASMMSEGYDYVEKTDDGGEIYREVRNLNEVFGVESGFENVVTHKIIKDKDGRVTGGIDFAPGTAVNSKTGEKTYWLKATISTTGSLPPQVIYIQLRPDVKEPKKEEEKRN